MLRDRGNQAILDIIIKNTKYTYDRKNSGLQSRIRSWENAVEGDIVSKKVKERSARCLYTVELAESGKQLKNSRIFIIIRAKDITTLNNAEKIVTDGLAQMGSTYMPAYGTIKDNLEYMSIIGNHATQLKDVTPVMTSNTVLAQLAPNCGSYNDIIGYYIGQNVLNGSPFKIDMSSISVARNIYVVAPSGVGKTVIAINMAQSAFEAGSACCFMDIKGNEYTSFIAATGGYVVSLRPTSIEYINSWIMHPEDTDPQHASAYFKSRVNFSKQQMMILSGITDKAQLTEFEELLDEFHKGLYITYGVGDNNMNSWKYTQQLNPYVVFDRFEAYMTPQKRSQYNISKTIMGTLRMYMSVNGSKSYVFKSEFDYAKIIDAPTLSFDFGILGDSSISDINVDLYRLKFLYMSKLNDEFVTRKYALGIRTFKVLEESQVVSDDILERYVREWTLRRAQLQDTLLLGNSVTALNNNKLSKAIIENTRGLLVGELTKEAREIVEEQFGIQHLDKYLRLPGSTTQYKNCFFFVNMMQQRELYPLIKVVMNPGKWDSKHKYKILTPVKEHSLMAGKKGE